MTSHLLDSSAWIEYLDGSERGAKAAVVVDEGEAATSILSLAEVGSTLHAKGKPTRKALEFMRQETRLLGVTADAAAKAGPFRNERRETKPAFSTMDALIYLTAREHGLILLTKDEDFNGLPGVELL